MEYCIIFTVFFLILVFTDLVPSIRQKRWKALYFSIPVYIAALVMNIMTGLGFVFYSPTQLIETVIKAVTGQK